MEDSKSLWDNSPSRHGFKFGGDLCEKQSLWITLSPRIRRLIMSSCVPLPNSESIPDRSTLSREMKNLTFGGSFGLDDDGCGVDTSDVCVLGMHSEIRVDVDYEGFAIVIFRYTFDSHV